MTRNQLVQKMENIERLIHVRHFIFAPMVFVFRILNVPMDSSSTELIVIGQAKLIALLLKPTHSRKVFHIYRALILIRGSKDLGALIFNKSISRTSNVHVRMVCIK